ncbi:MAG: hypothetical protein ACRDGS_08300 [Chloroflexota bacterium]
MRTAAQAGEGKTAYEVIDALGARVASMATVYVWPLDQRPVDDKGRHGSLHVKCAIADDDVLFISSANLTAYCSIKRVTLQCARHTDRGRLLVSGTRVRVSTAVAGPRHCKQTARKQHYSVSEKE